MKLIYRTLFAFNVALSLAVSSSGFAKDTSPSAAGSASAGSTFNGGQPELSRIKLRAGMHIISAEIADSTQTRANGLMNRSKMATNEGMLFVFERADTQCFWMRNTILPLSIAFMDDKGAIVSIADMKPQSDDSHCSAKPAKFALEMNQGWFAHKGVKPGSVIAGLNQK